MNLWFEKEEKRRLKEAILKSDDEKFKLFTKLMRIGKMLSNLKTTVNQEKIHGYS